LAFLKHGLSIHQQIQIQQGDMSETYVKDSHQLQLKTLGNKFVDFFMLLNIFISIQHAI